MLLGVTRLTRAESQERTRSRIVEAATALFLRDGFRATSVEQVAAEAGFTVGAVYSNFANKTELGVAVVDAMYEQELTRITTEVDEALDATPSRWLAALTNWQGSLLGDQRLMRLEIEINAFSTRDGTFGRATASRFARLRSVAAELIGRLEAEGGFALPVPRETAALAIVALVLGVGIQRAADPSIKADVVGDLLPLLLAGARQS